MSSQYTYPFPRPSLTVDIALFVIQDSTLRILLIRRKKAPFAGAWALPGGFVEEQEPLEDAARREMQEETGVTGLALKAFGAFGDPGRDPRGWTVSVAYAALGRSERIKERAADDAAQVRWFKTTHLPKLAFDHDEIIRQALLAIRSNPLERIRQAEIFSGTFTEKQLKNAASILLGRSLSLSQWDRVLAREPHLLRFSRSKAKATVARWIAPVQSGTHA